MFRKILIANRGEIACRVIDTARRLGVRTVAVFSDVDSEARHVAMADEAVFIGGPAPAESYLRGDRIIAAALQTGAEAIHPGYGFLSENPDFAGAVAQAGLVFIGPSAEAIRVMGLKDSAKAAMAEAGVPVVPGHQGADQSLAALSAAAAGIGYPVLIKAIAGGGGKGMRRIDRPGDFAAGLAAAADEAAAAFGNREVLIEKCIETPRHIEVQVFGDGRRAVHLHERDCSLQRRHQKVIEEAPAPGMTDIMRKAMGAAAVRAAEAIGYSGAGTVEFIVDAREGLHPDRFWFMEMNTRLQVEHPVTEAVTGIDLVEWQLRVASGEPLPLDQARIGLSGHGVEARLYAEDVQAGFLPATGRLTHLRFPAAVRSDSGVRTGDRISPWYDPMIAKIIAHGPTRDIALGRLTAALEEAEVAGSVTNLAFLIKLLRHPDVRAGQVDTGLIARELAALVPQDAVVDAPLVARAALALADIEAPAPLMGFSLWQPLERQLPTEPPVTLAVAGPDLVRVTVAGRVLDCRRGDGFWWIDGQKIAARVVIDPDRATVLAGARGTVCLRRIDALARRGEERAAGMTIAPMPGVVKAVRVTVGDRLERGDPIAVIEAMKMEHLLLAGRDGIVAEVLASVGAQVEAGAPLVRLEEPEQGAAVASGTGAAPSAGSDH